jgi:hypothetical protein
VFQNEWPFFMFNVIDLWKNIRKCLKISLDGYKDKHS